MRLLAPVLAALVLAGCGSQRETVLVPPLDTGTLANGLPLLARAGLRVSLTDFGPLPSGYALGDAFIGDQDPEPGTRVSVGSVVRLNMHGFSPIPSPTVRSQHPPTIAVPHFVGLVWPAAADRIREGFWVRIGHVPALGVHDADDALFHYVVTQQSPAPGTRVPYGGVRVGKGFRPTVVSLQIGVR